jgi:hypothetical protein
MLNLKVVVLNVIYAEGLDYAIMLNVILLNVVMLNVSAPFVTASHFPLSLIFAGKASGVSCKGYNQVKQKVCPQILDSGGNSSHDKHTWLQYCIVHNCQKKKFYNGGPCCARKVCQLLVLGLSVDGATERRK